MFEINFKKLIQIIVPYFLFKEKLRDYLFAATKGLETVHGFFKTFRIKSIKDLQFTGQLVYLEHILNDDFDNGVRGIYIINVNVNQFNFVYRKIENKPVYLSRKSEGATPFYLSRRAEYGFIVDFIVNVPIAVVFDSNQMKALINKYKLAGKRYKIETY
jgi:hypothetical protein